MKKTFTLLFLMAISSYIFAQISVTTADMPTSASKIRLSTATTIGSINYTATGANHTWDFSALNATSQTIDTFVAVTATSIYYYPSFVLTANQAEKQPNVNLGIMTLSNEYNFYKNATASYAMIGYGAQFSVIPIPIPLKYDNPDVIYKFPLNFNNVDSSASNGSVSLATLGYFGEKKKRKNTVDGWGTLTTPYGTFQVLRVKSVINVTDSLHLDTIMTFPINISRTITEYKWIAKNIGYPLVTITETSTGGLPATKTYEYIDSVRQFTGIEPINASKNIELSLYPNPSKEQTTISYNLNTAADVELLVYDITGKLVKTLFKEKQLKGSHQATFNTTSEGIYTGIYFVKLTVDNNSIVKKLVVL